MNQNKIKVQKAGKIVLILIRIVQTVLILSIAFSILSYVFPLQPFAPRVSTQGEYFYLILSNSVTSVLILSILSIVSALLGSLRTTGTPFTIENVKRLKIISVLLIAIEPVQMLFNGVSNAVRPLTANGEKMVSVTSMGGIVMVLGLIVFCVALVFEYGVDLQKQSDETL